MYCDVFKTDHKTRTVFVSLHAAPWVTYEAMTKSKEYGYELIIVQSDREVKNIIKEKLLDGRE